MSLLAERTACSEATEREIVQAATSAELRGVVAALEAQVGMQLLVAHSFCHAIVKHHALQLDMLAMFWFV